MPYILNTSDQQQEMLKTIGIDSINQLFEMIPDNLRLDGDLDIPAALSEMELQQTLEGLAAKNLHSGNSVCFLGGGSYDHFVPAAVDAIASRGEFYTSYTPYQPEVSQGNLQAIFEYQSLICQLTGMDVSNASLYDGGSAAVEAVLMAMSASKRLGKVVTSSAVHPETLDIIRTYLKNLGTELVVVDAPNGQTSIDELANRIDDETACVLIQSPNFFGVVEDVSSVSDLAHEHGALSVCSFDPISLGMLKRPGDMEVDIAVAEGQSLGTPMLYGGPYLGIMACRETFVRRLPGRIAGQTVDRRGKRCWVLTLQTREQHIRREKATSNICTNQGLFALRAAIYLALQGPHGLRETATLCHQKARFALDQITSNERFSLVFPSATFKEFVIRDKDDQVTSLLKHCRDQGIQAGIPLSNWFPDMTDCFLVAVTEQRTKAEIERLAACLHAAPSSVKVS